MGLEPTNVKNRARELSRYGTMHFEYRCEGLHSRLQGPAAFCVEDHNGLVRPGRRPIPSGRRRLGEETFGLVHRRTGERGTLGDMPAGLGDQTVAAERVP